MPLELPPQFIVFDTEYTAWEGSQERDWSGPNEHRELVQIGALRVTFPNLNVTAKYQQLLTPIINPQLSGFFTRLTGITQAQVDQYGRPPHEGIAEFAAWSGSLPLYCYSRRDDRHDGDIVQENCRLRSIPCPITPERFHNIADIFKAHGITTKQYVSSTIVEAFGTKPTRRGHDALNDTRTIVDGLRLLQKQLAH